MRDALRGILGVGRYADVVVTTPGGLRFAEREVILDCDLSPDAIIDSI